MADTSYHFTGESLAAYIEKVRASWGADEVYDALIETNAVLGALIVAQPERNLIPELEKRYAANLRALAATPLVTTADI